MQTGKARRRSRLLRAALEGARAHGADANECVLNTQLQSGLPAPIVPEGALEGLLAHGASLASDKKQEASPLATGSENSEERMPSAHARS